MQCQQLRQGSALVPLAAHRQACSCSRTVRLKVECKQQRRRAGTRKKKPRLDIEPSTTKGFGQMLIDDDDIISIDKGFKMPDVPFYAAYNQPSYSPQRYVGPVQLQQVQGKGRGLVTSREVIPGDLLLVSLPLAFLEGALGEAPGTEDLVAAMIEEAWSERQRRLLGLLYDGSEASMQQAASLDDLAAEGGGGGGGGGGEAGMVDSERLRRVVESCSYGDEFQDPACMQVRHQAPLGLLGLWPEFAFLNHSCAPNTSVTVVKGTMFVHATDVIQPGEEVTTSYLGRTVMAPRQQRQQLLRDNFGFRCACSRCQLEEASPAEAQELMQQLHAQAPAWQEAFAAAVSAGDLPSIQVLYDEVAELLGQLESHLAQMPDLSEDQAMQVKAGAYDAYDLLCQADDIIRFEDPDAGHLRQCLELVRAVARGSESHTAAAARLDRLAAARWEANTTRVTSRLRRAGRGGLAEKKLLQAAELVRLEAEQAVERLYESFFCRYGFIGDQLVSQLVNAQEVFYEGLADLAAGGPETERVKELNINGVRVTVTDKLGIGGSSGSSGEPGSVIEDTGIRLQFVESLELGGGAGSRAGGERAAGAQGEQDVEMVEVAEGDEEELAAEQLIAELMAADEGPEGPGKDDSKRLDEAEEGEEEEDA